MSKNYLDFKRSSKFPFMRDVVIDKITIKQKNKDIFFSLLIWVHQRQMNLEKIYQNNLFTAEYQNSK